MKKRLVVFVYCLLFFSATALATNLRGRVLRYDPSTKNYTPLINTRVEIHTWDGKNWVQSAYAMTGKDGFYYFVNLHPGAQFKVQVLGKFYPPQPLFTQNLQSPHYQDIPQIIL
jgi:hypothetical protein